ncbi:MAG: GAF domain-containing protein [Nitrospinae bacterium]|nr:GAF domain-containing protein [Nitrospinota bacterium]
MGDGDESLSSLSAISAGRLELGPLLMRVVTAVSAALPCEVVALLLLDETQDTLMLKCSIGLSGWANNAVRLPRDRGVSWTIVRERRTLRMRQASAHPDYYFVPESGEGRFTSLMGTPLVDGGDVVGALYVQSEAERDYTDDEAARLEAICRNAGGAVRLAWRMEQSHERARILTELHTLSQLLSASEGSEEILSHAQRYVASLTGARRVLFWLAGDDGKLEGGHYPASAGEVSWLAPVKDGLVAHVARERQPVDIRDVEGEERFPELSRVARRSLQAHPLEYGGGLVGVMVAADRSVPHEANDYPFSGDEGQTLATVSRLTAQALSRARTHRRLAMALDANQRNVRELSMLFQLSTVMQRTVDLEKLLRVILSCVTVGSGLGFNRAILFLVNEASGRLNGVIGLGPSSEEEAGRIWSELEGKTQNLADFVRWLLAKDTLEIAESPFSGVAQSLSFSLEEDGVLARAVREGRAINVQGIPPGAPADNALTEALAGDRFAVAPLVASGAAVGAILVDNKINRRPITDADLELLTRFTAPASWAIENAKLMERLSTLNGELVSLERQMAHVERVSALGEIYAELAHELKNPLVTIGGFAQRLARRATTDETTAHYSAIIVDEVERLEKLLRNTLDVSRNVHRVNLSLSDLNRVAEDVVDVYWRMIIDNGVECALSLTPNLPLVSIDEAQIRQVVVNLILNAVEAMGCPRHGTAKRLTIRTHLAVEGEPMVRLSVTDTGGGVAPYDLAKIMDPFFTTKATGTGLGLPLCNKIVRMHRGVLEIDNQLGVGVTFTINLPCESAGQSDHAPRGDA